MIIATGTGSGNIGTLHASGYFKELRALRQAVRGGVLLSPDTLIPATPTDIVQRQVKVIDHELATMSGRRVGEGLAIYFVEGRKISKVCSLQEKDH